MKLVRIKAMTLVQVEEQCVQNLTAENRMQCICLSDSQISMLKGKRGHNLHLLWIFWQRTAWRRI